MSSELAELPLSPELLEYYRKRIQESERDYSDFLKEIDAIKVSYSEKHKLEWELFQRNKEVQDLQRALSESQSYLYDERRHLLRLTAENDRYKIQEMKDRKKIRYLLSVSKIEEDEITYFKKFVDRRFVKDGEEPVKEVVSERAKSLSEKSFKEIYDIDESKEMDIDVLRLLCKSLRAQLEEHTKLNDEQTKGLLEDNALKEQEEKVRSARDQSKIEELQKKNQKLENLLRENTRGKFNICLFIYDLLEKKKRFQTLERRLKEEKNQIEESLKVTTTKMEEVKTKAETVERVVEAKLKKKQDLLIQDLRMQAAKYESESKDFKSKYEKYKGSVEKKLDVYERRYHTAVSNLNALKQRRQREIEGFTNDINLLRKEIQILENSLLQQRGGLDLDDKELLLLTLARETGKKASKVSSELHNLKAKMYKVERDVRALAF